MTLKILDDSVIQPISDASGLHTNLVRMALCLVSSYPLCAILKRLPDNNRALKEIYILAGAIFYLVGIFNLWGGLRTLLVSILGTYILTKYLRGNPFMPWVVFLFVMGHLFTTHVDAQFHDYDQSVADISGAQMVLCMKLTSFAWNIHDGTSDESSLSEFQKDRMIKQHPKLLDFLAYCLFFPSLLTGPSYDYREFERWIDLSMFDVTLNDPRRKWISTKKRVIPRSGRFATWKLVQGLLWIAIWTNADNYISLEHARSPQFVQNNPFLYRILYLYLLGITYRLKYYGAWSISEGACILSGLGFNGKTANGKYRWDRVKNIDPWIVETAQNAHTFLGSWNMNTSKWLRNYVYLRVTPKGRKPGFRSTLATFVTSALWHGTRPGYYITFVTGAFYQAVGKIFRRNLRPIFMEADGVTPGKLKPYYDLVCMVVTQLSFGYLCQPFVLLELKPSLYILGTVYYFAHVLIAVVLFLFHGPLRKPLTKYLQSLQPKPLKAADKVKLDSNRLKEIRKEIDQLQSRQPSGLGVPEPDFDHFDEDLQSAVTEFEELKSDITQELQNLRNFEKKQE